jgi:hypothetical protein
MERQRYRALVLAGLMVTAFGATDVSAQESDALGDQKTLVILADFTDSAITCSVDFIRNLVFGATDSVDALYRNNSSGKTSFSGDVVGPYALNRATSDECSLSALSMAAEASATAAGVNVGSYPRRVYVMPPNSCGAGGKGTVGGTPSQAWVFACNLPGVFAHNLGHNLGMAHSSSAAPLPDEEYGDPSDPMAFGSDRLPGFNAPHRHQLGWLTSTGLRDVSADTDVSIALLSLDPATVTAPQTVTIRKPSTNDYYYLSYRRPVGFDQGMDSRFFDRVSVHRYKGDGSTANTYWVANLDTNESYTDSIDGIAVTVTARTTTSAALQIRFSAPACVPSAVSASAAPQSQSGAAGAAVNYSISLTNQDGPGCAPTALALSAVSPAGWTGTLSPANLTLPPGASAQATLTLVPSSTAASGSYGATVLVNDAATAAHSTSAGVTYMVVAQDSQPPSAPQITMAKVRAKRIELAWSGSNDNDRVAGYRVWRNGVMVASPTTTSWVDQSTASGNLTYVVDAYDPTGNVSAPSGAVTVTLSSSNGRPK